MKMDILAIVDGEVIEGACHITRPDTQPIPVADWWAGAVMRVFTLSNSITTDQQTDKASYRVACPQLKMKERTKESKKER